MEVSEIEKILEKERENPSYALSLGIIDEALKAKLLTRDDEKLFTQHPRRKCNFIEIFHRLSRAKVLVKMQGIDPNAKVTIGGTEVMFRMGTDYVSIDQRDFATTPQFSCNLGGHIVVDNYEDLCARIENRYDNVCKRGAIQEMLEKFDLVEMASGARSPVQWCFDNLHGYVDKIQTQEDLLVAIIDRQKRLAYSKTLRY